MRVAVIQTLLWALPTFLLLALCYWLLCFTLRRKTCKKSRNAIVHQIGVTVFLLYFAVLLTAITDVDTIWVCLLYRLRLPDIAWFQSSPTLLPYIPKTAEDILQLILNVVLFIPAGFLCPLDWKETRPWTFVVVFVCFSLVVEIGQFITGNRTADVNDFLANSIGAVCGYLLWLCCHARWPKAFESLRTR